VNKYGGIK